MYDQKFDNSLFINSLKELVWSSISTNYFEYTEKNSIWRIKVSDFVSKKDILQEILQPEEVEKALRYRQETDQNYRIIGRAALRILLGKYIEVEPKAIRFFSDEYQKPQLKNETINPVYFNVSHSGAFILIAIAPNPIGIDVEKLDTVFTYQNLLEDCFSQIEADFIEKSATPEETFFKLWTRKEAFLKATGKGLTVDLTKVPCLDEKHHIPEKTLQSANNWQTSSFNVDENHICSITFMPVKTALQFFNFQF